METKNNAEEDTGKISRDERTELIESGRAGVIFHARTKIDPSKDPIILKVAAVSVAAALIKQVSLLEEWVKPVRRSVRGIPPGLPGWIKPILRAVLAGKDKGEDVVDQDDDDDDDEGDDEGDDELDSSNEVEVEPEPAFMVNFAEAAGIAPGKQVDLVSLTDKVIAFREDVLRIVGVGKALGEELEQVLAELTHVQTDDRGRRGAFLEALGPGKPRDEARWRFLNRLHRQWREAERGELEPTETGLLAVYLGIDDGRGGVDGVVKRWSEMIQKAKSIGAAKPK